MLLSKTYNFSIECALKQLCAYVFLLTDTERSLSLSSPLDAATPSPTLSPLPPIPSSLVAPLPPPPKPVQSSLYPEGMMIRKKCNGRPRTNLKLGGEWTGMRRTAEEFPARAGDASQQQRGRGFPLRNHQTGVFFYERDEFWVLLLRDLSVLLNTRWLPDTLLWPSLGVDV